MGGAGFFVDGDEGEVDVGFAPDDVVREAAAEDGGEDGLVLFELGGEGVEGVLKLGLDRAGGGFLEGCRGDRPSSH